MADFNIIWVDGVPTTSTIVARPALELEFASDIQRITKTYDKDAIWIRQNGEEIPMVRMDSQHVINALRMYKRNYYDPMIENRYELLLLEAIHRKLINKDAGEWDSEENTI